MKFFWERVFHKIMFLRTWEMLPYSLSEYLPLACSCPTFVGTVDLVSPFYVHPSHRQYDSSGG